MHNLNTSWAAVGMMDEPAPLIIAWARHHLAIGASEVFVFLDSPNPEAENHLAALDGCHVEVLNDAYWTRHTNGTRPPKHTARQRHAATKAYAKTSCDWLLHCDADEFISDGAALVAELSDAPKDAPLVIRTLERAYAPDMSPSHMFSGLFKKPIDWDPIAAKEIFAPYEDFFERGFTGQKSGKPVVPTGHDWDIGVHRALFYNSHDTVPSERIKRCRLLHFDGLTPLHYAFKIIKRLHIPAAGAQENPASPRSKQMRFFQTHKDDQDKILGIIKGTKFLTNKQFDAFDLFGGLVQTSFTPKGCEDVDLSIEKFDAALLQKDRRFFEMENFDIEAVKALRNG